MIDGRRPMKKLKRQETNEIRALFLLSLSKLSVLISNENS